VELGATGLGTVSTASKLKREQQSGMHHILRFDRVETVTQVLNSGFRHARHPDLTLARRRSAVLDHRCAAAPFRPGDKWEYFDGNPRTGPDRLPNGRWSVTN